MHIACLHYKSWGSKIWLKKKQELISYLGCFIFLFRQIHTRLLLILVGNSSTIAYNEVSSPLTPCRYRQIFFFCSWKAVCQKEMAFSLQQLFEHFPSARVWIELFQKLFCYLRRWQGQCSWLVGSQFAWGGSGLKVSACLEMGLGILTDPNNVNRGWCIQTDNMCFVLLCALVCHMHTCFGGLLHRPTHVTRPNGPISC